MGTLMIYQHDQGVAIQVSCKKLLARLSKPLSREAVYLLVEENYLSEAQSYLGDQVVYLNIPTNAWLVMQVRPFS